MQANVNTINSTTEVLPQRACLVLDDHSHTFAQPLVIRDDIQLLSSELVFSDTTFMLASLFPFEGFDLKNQGNCGFRVDSNGVTYIEVMASLRAYIDDPDSEVAKYSGGHSVLKAHIYGQNLDKCSEAEAENIKQAMLNSQYKVAAEYLHEAACQSVQLDAKCPQLAEFANAVMHSDQLDIFNRQLNARFAEQ